MGVSRFSVKNFLSHSAENLRWEPFTVALFSGTEKVWIEGGGIKTIRPIFLSHSVEKFRRGILYCCINFRWRKSLWTRGGKGVSRFSIKDFLSHSAENLRREFFTVALFSGTEKVWIEGGEYQDNLSNYFCLTVSKITVGEFFTVALNSSSEKVYGQEGGREYQNFTSKIFCLIVPKISVGESFTVAFFPVAKKYMDKRTKKSIKMFHRKFFVQQCRKSP